MRGELGIRYSIWAFQVRQEQDLELMQAAAMMEKKMAERTKFQAVGKLGLIFARISRGLIALRIRRWATKMARATGEAVAAAEAIAAAEAVAEAVATRAKMRASNKLQEILGRMMRGKAGRRLGIWKSSATKVHGKRHSLSMLRVVLAKIIRGEIGMRLQLWRWHFQQATRRSSATAMHTMMVAQQSFELQTSTSATQRICRLILQTGEKATTVRCLQQWRLGSRFATTERVAAHTVRGWLRGQSVRRFLSVMLSMERVKMHQWIELWRWRCWDAKLEHMSKVMQLMSAHADTQVKNSDSLAQDCKPLICTSCMLIEDSELNLSF